MEESEGDDKMVAMVEDRLLTVEEVADALRVSPWVVRNWLRRGELRGVYLGSRKTGWRVRDAELQRFISARERGGEGMPHEPRVEDSG